jgi:hypothetical protein
MKVSRPSVTITILQAIGFSLVVVAIWVNEMSDLPHHLFGSPITPFNWHEAAFESVFVIFLGASVMMATWHRSKRIARLESLLPICMICKKIRKPDMAPELDESWESLEQYINDRTGSKFSHGLCPSCAEKKYGVSRSDL